MFLTATRGEDKGFRFCCFTVKHGLPLLSFNFECQAPNTRFVKAKLSGARLFSCFFYLAVAVIVRDLVTGTQGFFLGRRSQWRLTRPCAWKLWRLPENVDDDGGFKILRDILAYVPEDAAPGRPFGGLLPEVVIPHDMFNAMTIKLICSSIEKELFQRCYSRASVKAMSYCGLSLGSKTPSLKARSMPPGTRFYLAGTVTSEMSQNCIPLCARSLGA